MLTVQTNPAIHYRAYTVGGRQVPPQGYPVREGALLVLVINPDGITLGGDFEGVHVPANSSIAAGFYNIEVINNSGEPTGEELVISFRSAEPLPPVGPEEKFLFICEAESDTFGSGLAQGITNPQVIHEDDNAIVQSNVRTVITFSNLGGL